MDHLAVAALLAALAGLAPACSSPNVSTGSGGGGGTGGAGAADGGDAGAVLVRGQRYCEILLATIQGGAVHAKVYSTEGLDDCPEAAWSMESPMALETATMSSFALLNGPRYWTVDSLAGSTLIDPTVVMLGGIAMRQAGGIDVPAANLSILSKPYTQHTIERHSDFHFFEGSTVYELVDPSAHVYEMQSYSVQTTTQSEATLPTLGSRLALPSGWMFRTRVLDADLELVATNGTAIVVQDDLSDTYLMSQ